MMKATPRSCAIGFSTRAARRIVSSSQSLRRNCSEATSPTASASSSSFANRSGSSAGGVIKYSRVVASASFCATSYLPIASSRRNPDPKKRAMRCDKRPMARFIAKGEGRRGPRRVGHWRSRRYWSAPGGRAKTALPQLLVLGDNHAKPLRLLPPRRPRGECGCSVAPARGGGASGDTEPPRRVAADAELSRRAASAVWCARRLGKLLDQRCGERARGVSLGRRQYPARRDAVRKSRHAGFHLHQEAVTLNPLDEKPAGRSSVDDALRSQGPDLRCVRDSGELARQHRPRGEEQPRTEGVRQGLACLRRPVASALSAGDGPRASGRAPLG